MKSISELNLGFSDAANYKRRSNKDLFNHFFVRLPQLDRLLQPDRYFLIGDKGTGKTAFAVFLSNNSYRSNKCTLVAINETEYQSFITLKRTNNLQLSGYDHIWRVIVLLLLSQQIGDNDYDANFIGRYKLFQQLQGAISDYYRGAFSPEIITALKLVESSEESVKLLLKVIEGEAKEKRETTSEEQRFQSNLRVIERKFIDALGRLRLHQNMTLFIDGLDIRPHGIAYEDYLECIRGLANAVWHLNHNVFPTFKDSVGRFKVVILLRPDIFASLGLQNQNAKIQDNAVYLDWLTTYPQYRDSEIFEVADKLLGVQQQDANCLLGDAWDYYFPFLNADNEPCFVSFLRFSFFRPRDINKMMTLLRDNFIRFKRPSTDVFTLSDFNHSDFRRDYSNYLIGEVKDYLQFYYTDDDIGMFLKFFSYLGGKVSFTLNDFKETFERFSRANFREPGKCPPFFEDYHSFLQFLYEIGVVCYKEYTTSGVFYHLCFRERTYANMHPKVSFEADEYIIHYGLRKALGLGAQKQIQHPRPKEI
jgi:hypothetical protein